MDTTKIGENLFVGQTNALSLIQLWKNNDSFPHFLIISGEAGSGRRTLSYIFAKELDAQISIVSDLSVDNVRSVIENSYLIDSKVVYLIPDADKMSAASKNSMLKFTEEPPKNAYIIMTLTSLNNTLHTLQSRSQHIIMSPYTYSELSQLCNQTRLCKIATTPGMLKRLESMDNSEVDKLIDTAEKLVDYINKVSVSNALKSASCLKFKESDKGIDIDLMLATIDYIINSRLQNMIDKEEINLELLTRIQCWSVSLSEWRLKFSYSGVKK